MTRSLLAAGLILLVGCDAADDPVDELREPTPIAAFAFDAGVDAFPASDDPDARVGPNYANASLRVGIVSTIVGLNLVLPSLATEAATRRSPELVDGAFVWSNTVDVLGTPVDVRLTGDPRGSGVDWTLETAEAGDDFFTFYTGRTTLNGTVGDWRLFTPDDGAVLTADFDAPDRDDREITFGVPPGRDRAGTTVLYAVDGDELTFDLRNQPDGTRALIVWDERTGAGSITADTYNGGERACWDAALNDVEC